jgi:DNA-binding GntR family transcriptional regulator
MPALYELDVLNVQIVPHNKDVLAAQYAHDMVDHLDPTPLYQQLADELRQQIESGQIRKGEQIPSESYLRQEHGVSRGTVRQAVSLLREWDLVITLPGRATVVK